MDMLDEVARNCNVLISDLRTRKHYKEIYFSLVDLKEEIYTLKEWNEAAKYMLRDEELTFDSKDDVIKVFFALAKNSSFQGSGKEYER